jgi:hypothetical protein
MAASDKRILKIDMDGCNSTYMDDTFDRNNATGTYQLDVLDIIISSSPSFLDLSLDLFHG